jgi:nitroreductase
MSVKEAIEKRRAIRKYQAKEVPENLILNLYDSVTHGVCSY